MSKGRRPTKTSKHYILTVLWDYAISFCRCYPQWLAELSVCDSSCAIRYDKDRVQTSNNYDPTETLGIRRAELEAKIKVVEDAAAIAARDEVIRELLILGVTHGLSYNTLKTRYNIPCGLNQYHESRRTMIKAVADKIS